MEEWREKRKRELLELKLARDQYCGKYRALKCERDMQDYRGFAKGFCLLHDRMNPEDPLHAALSAIARDHPDVSFGHLHQSLLTIDEMRDEPKPCLIRFQHGEIVSRAESNHILEIFQRSSMQASFSSALQHALEAHCEL